MIVVDIKALNANACLVCNIFNRKASELKEAWSSVLAINNSQLQQTDPHTHACANVVSLSKLSPSVANDCLSDA